MDIGDAGPQNGKISPPNYVEIGKIHGNLSPDIVQITTDKLGLILHKHAGTLEKRKAWIAPLGLVIALTLSLITSDFKDIGFSKSTWTAIFFVADFLSIIWLLIEGSHALRSVGIDDLVEKIKRQQT